MQKERNAEKSTGDGLANCRYSKDKLYDIQ